MERIQVINYGGSNLRSVVKAVESVADKNQLISVTDNPADLKDADRVIFPGQGAIGDCVKSLVATELLDAVKEAAESKPFFGICLGLQSLMSFSDEDGGTDCLDILPGVVKRFPSNPPAAADGTPQKIPHMGWNQVRWEKPHPLNEGIPDGSRFYFVHSYFVIPEKPEHIAARTQYIKDFVSAVSMGSAFATQFHPEKSAEQGQRLLRNFLNWDGTV